MSWTDVDRRRLARYCAAGTLGLAGIAVLYYSASPTRVEGSLFGYWRIREILAVSVLVLAALGAFCLARGRGAWLGFWSCLLPAVSFCAVLEISGRAGLIDWSALLESQPAQTRGVGWSPEPDVHVVGETGQDIATRLGLPHEPIAFSFRTDRYGFRNPPGEEGEIVMLGDSIVLGAAVPVEQTVAEIVQQALGVPVMQAALLGLSIQGEHDLILNSDLPLAGRTVVQFLFEGNDLLDSRSYRQRRDAAAPDGEVGGVGAPASLLRLVWSKLVRLSNPPADYHTCKIGDQTVAFLWTRLAFAGVEDEFDRIARSVLDFRETLARRGADFVLVLVPTKYRVLEQQCEFPRDSALSRRAENLSDLPDRIHRWSGENGVELIDLTAALQAGARAGTLPWFWGDTHWNAVGHQLAGHEIAARLADRRD